MNGMNRNTEHIAKTLRVLRKQLGLTQENLAAMAGVSTRTVEKAESGRHRPEEQTLRSFARAVGMDVAIFALPTPAQEEELRAAFERLKRKALLVRTRPILTLADFRREFGERHALQVDTGAAEDEAAIDVAASTIDLLNDLGDSWSDLSETERVEMGRAFMAAAEEMRQLGRVWYMGHYRRRLRSPGKPDLVLSVTLVSLQPIEGADERFAYVEMEGAWETLEADGPRLPD